MAVSSAPGCAWDMESPRVLSTLILQDFLLEKLVQQTQFVN